MTVLTLIHFLGISPHSDVRNVTNSISIRNADTPREEKPAGRARASPRRTHPERALEALLVEPVHWGEDLEELQDALLAVEVGELSERLLDQFSERFGLRDNHKTFQSRGCGKRSATPADVGEVFPTLGAPVPALQMPLVRAVSC